MQRKESHENSPLCCGWELMTSYDQTGIILYFDYKQWVACSLIFSQKMPKITQNDISPPHITLSLGH